MLKTWAVELSEIHRREIERRSEADQAAEAEKEGEEMTQILSPLIVSYINNSNYVQLHERFGFISDVLKNHGLRQAGWELRPPGHEDEIWAEIGFVFDFESIPNMIRGPVGENKRGGASHDPICRIGFIPGITKSIAADVYFEIMEYCDSIDTQRFAAEKHPYLPNGIIVPYVKTKDWSRRWIKSEVVRYWPGDYFLKYLPTATALEMYGIGADPYVTIEKLDAAIVESKETTAAIKPVPDQVAEKPAMLEASEKVTADLKDAKKDAEEKK
jgi:hypothetical protein